MTNNQVKFWYKKIPYLKKRIKNLKSIIKVTMRNLERYENILEQLSYGEIVNYNGIMLRITEMGVSSPDSKNKRSIRIYKNVHNNTTWGAELYDYSKSYFNREEWIGAGYKTKKELIDIGINYVAYKIKPEEKDRCYIKK